MAFKYHITFMFHTSEFLGFFFQSISCPIIFPIVLILNCHMGGSINASTPEWMISSGKSDRNDEKGRYRPCFFWTAPDRTMIFLQGSGILATCCSSCALLEANLLTVGFRGDACTFSCSLDGATALARCTVSTRRGDGARSTASRREPGICRKEGKNGSRASKFGEIGDSMAGF